MRFYIIYQNTRNRIFDDSQVSRGWLFHNTAIFGYSRLPLYSSSKSQGESSDEANVGLHMIGFQVTRSRLFKNSRWPP